jgi:hypothetical protein
MIDREQNNSADQGAEETRGFSSPVPANELSEISRKNRTQNTDCRSDKETARVSPRCQHFRNQTHYKSNQNCPDDLHFFLVVNGVVNGADIDEWCGYQLPLWLLQCDSKSTRFDAQADITVGLKKPDGDLMHLNEHEYGKSQQRAKFSAEW